MTRGPVATRLAARIRRRGPIPFDEFMEVALYDSDGGFFATGHGAGRSRGDFVTSPETGSLFGALVAAALDGWWHDLGEPDPYVVVEAGAGRGRLGREVLRATPECAQALRYVLVERAAVLREEQRAVLEPAVAIEPPEEVLGPVVAGSDPDDDAEPVPGQGPLVASLDALPATLVRAGVVIANELLDNLAYRIVQRSTTGWDEVRIALAGEQLVEILVPAPAELGAGLDPAIAPGVRVPVPVGARAWLDAVSGFLRSGVLALVDYGAPHAELAARGGWLRTYAGHHRGEDPLIDPGAHDITVDVPTDLVVAAAQASGWQLFADRSQADWLRSLGLDARVAAARAAWAEGRARADLAALAARSLVHEADALTDPAGLGAFRVLELRR